MAAARPVDEIRAASLPMFKNVELPIALNKWRLAQNPPMSPNAAIEELLLRALAAEGAMARPTGGAQVVDAEVEALVEQFRSLVPRARHNPKD